MAHEENNDENKYNKLEIFFRQTMELQKKEIIKDSGNHSHSIEQG